jgi:peptidoglycan/xylan/chitin deacetylase (PgdA/CDA1 family)
VDLLQRYRVMASWTAAAMSLEAHPEIADAIRALGHEPIAHGYRWVHQFRMSEEEERAFIRRAADSIGKTTGTRPLGWLSRYLLTPATRRLLIEEGFGYHMDDYSGDIPFRDGETLPGRPITIMPYALDTNDMKMWTDPAYGPQAWLDYARASFDQLWREGEAGYPKMMSLGLHLRIIGRPGRIWALEAFLQHVAARPDVWIASRGQIARHFEALHPA